MTTSNKVGFVLLVLLIGWAISFCLPPREAELPAPSPAPSSTGLRFAPQSAPTVTP